MREASPTQSRYNTTPKGASKYLGVSKSTKNGIIVGWQVGITINGKQTYIGHRKTEIEAAKLYNEHAIIHYGEFANLNIIPE